MQNKTGELTMKYHMRRIEREITSIDKINSIIEQGKFATIAMCYQHSPYVITLSYGYNRESQTLYFHSANSGKKVDILKANPEICMTVIQDDGYIDGECGHSYKSVVIYGKMELIENDMEKRNGIEIIINHLESKPKMIIDKFDTMKEKIKNTNVYKVKIIKISGKEGR